MIRGLILITILSSIILISAATQDPPKHDVRGGELQSQETINALIDQRVATLEGIYKAQAEIVQSINDKLNFLLGSLGVVGLGGAGAAIRKQMRKPEEE